MADVLCPTCGKPNPANQDTCRFCQSALPVTSAADLPDWLSSLDQGGSTPDSSTPAPQDDAPDWLSRLGGFDGGAAPAAPPPPAASAADLPSWLGGSSESVPETPAWDSSPAAPTENLPDWLSGGSGSAESDWFNASPTAFNEEPAELESPEQDFSPTVPASGFSNQNWEETPAEKADDGTPSPDWFIGGPQQPAAIEPEPEPLDWLASAAGGAAAEEETVDWFSQFQSDAPGAAAGQQDAAPDWMAGPVEPAASKEEAAFDWTSAAEPAAPQPEAASDWLSEPAAPQESTSFDWISGTTEPAASKEEAAFDWPSAAEPATPQEASFDWLSGPAEPAAPQTEAAPDWMASLGAAEPATPQEASFDWLSSPAEPAAPRTEAAPDWMASLGAAEPAASEEAAPDWLSQLSDTEPGAAAPAAETGFNWEQPAAAGPAVSPFDSLEDLPPSSDNIDWSSGGLGEKETQAEDIFSFGGGASPFSADQPQPAPAAPAEADDSPDWLRSLNAAPEAEPAYYTPPAEEPAAAGAFDMSSETPDWLSGFDGQGGSGAPALVMDESAGALETGEPQPPSGEADFLSSMPDWLSQVSAEEGGRPAEEAEPAQAQGNLAQANLPTWLQAMRPVESAAPQSFKDMSDGRVESAGPLAGLRGALPAPLDLKSIHKPGVYSLKLQLPDDQQQRMTLLQDLVAGESAQTTRRAKAAALPSQALFRVMIFLALLLAVFGALFYGDGPIGQPAPEMPQTIEDFYLKVNNVPPAMPVLLAVDYEPAFAAELEPALRIVLKQLGQNGSHLALASTLPTGPVQAEYLLAAAQAAGVAWASQPANLGYLPGGPAGLVALANDPARALPYTIDGKSAWSSTQLDPDKKLSNFSMVIVATDSAETARLWIEQIGPLLDANDIPLLMITSAQAEPLARAYYSAAGGRVDGLIGGLAGSLDYQRYSGQDTPLQNAYRAAVLASVLIILLGGLINLRAANRQPRPKAAPAEKPQPKAEAQK